LEAQVAIETVSVTRQLVNMISPSKSCSWILDQPIRFEGQV